MAHVLDASAGVALIAPSQRTAAAVTFASTNLEDVIAPSLFRLEVRHALLRLERRQPSLAGTFRAGLAAVEQLISFRGAPNERDLNRYYHRAQVTGLSVYDAAYLDLALVEGASLVSRDARLLRAALAHGVALVDLS